MKEQKMKPAKLTPKFKPNPKLLKDHDLQNDYTSEDLKYKIEGAFDQFDYMLDAMDDTAEREMFHDYPEIKAVYNELYKFKTSTPNKELIQVLHKLTKSFNLKGKKLELFADNDKIHLDFKQLDKELAQQKNIENTVKKEPKLNAPKPTPWDNLKDKTEEKKKKELEEENNKKLKHPFMINNKPTLRP